MVFGFKVVFVIFIYFLLGRNWFYDLRNCKEIGNLFQFRIYVFDYNFVMWKKEGIEL